MADESTRQEVRAVRIEIGLAAFKMLLGLPEGTRIFDMHVVGGRSFDPAHKTLYVTVLHPDLPVVSEGLVPSAVIPSVEGSIKLVDWNVPKPEGKK